MPSSFSQDEDCRQSVKVWLTDGNYYINNSPPNLSLYCQSPSDIKKCMSLDAFRFATHSAQTVFEMEKTSAYPKLTSWRVIQAYYAAYFSAHAILRFFGRSFSYLESGHVQFLKARCDSEAGYLPNLPSSYYTIDFSPIGQNVIFRKVSESHKGLWVSFGELLGSASQSALSIRASEVRREELSQIFSDLADALSMRGRYPAGNWLSVVRNNVNYRSMQGAWFPFSKSTPSFEALMGRVRDWRKCTNDLENPNLIKNELERFFITAFSVIDMGLSIGLDYQEIVNASGRRSADFSRLLKTSAAA
jgi:hypothetical protein